MADTNRQSEQSGPLVEAQADACAKAILVGEHFVVWGGTALAIPVRPAQLMVKVKGRPAGRNRIALDGSSDLRLLAAARLGMRLLRKSHRHSLGVSVVANFPHQAGLGASAAFSVAFCRAIMALAGEEDEDLVAQAALDLEQVFHGQPSGIDSTTIAFGSPCYVKTGTSFVNGQSAGPMSGFIDVHPGAVFLLADSGERGNTAEAVGRVAALRGGQRGEHMVQRLTEVAETIALQTATALRKGDFEYVGTMMSENHHLLTALEVTTDRLELLRRTALDAGALGAKLTGSGLGGFLLALCWPDDVDRVKAALSRRGVGLFFEQPTEQF